MVIPSKYLNIASYFNYLVWIYLLIKFVFTTQFNKLQIYMCLSLHLSFHHKVLSIYLSTFICLPTLSIYLLNNLTQYVSILPTSLSIYLFVYPPDSLTTTHLSVCQSIVLSVYQPIYWSNQANNEFQSVTQAP